jgi:hypothetical protein
MSYLKEHHVEEAANIAASFFSLERLLFQHKNITKSFFSYCELREYPHTEMQ